MTSKQALLKVAFSFRKDPEKNPLKLKNTNFSNLALQTAAGAAAGTAAGVVNSRRHQLEDQQKAQLKSIKALSKSAMTDETKKELASVGSIALLGGVATSLADRIKPHMGSAHSGKKMFALGTGLGLISDYAGLKIGKSLGGKIPGGTQEKQAQEREKPSVGKILAVNAGTGIGAIGAGMHYIDKNPRSMRIPELGIHRAIPGYRRKLLLSVLGAGVVGNLAGRGAHQLASEIKDKK